MAKKKSAQSTITKRLPIARDPRSGGEIFMQELGPGPSYVLSRIAMAIFVVDKRRQDAVLQFLREGQLVASIRQPRSGKLIQLPYELWEDVDLYDFNIRKSINGTWRNYNYELPSHLVLKHIAAPRLRAVALAAAESSKGDNDGLRASVSGLEEAIGLLDTNRQWHDVFVTVTDARSFADSCLGAVWQQENRGPKKTSDSEAVVIEMFRRLHFLPYESLPNHKRFESEMLQWWNFQKREPRGIDWIEDYRKFVWAAIQAGPQKPLAAK